MERIQGPCENTELCAERLQSCVQTDCRAVCRQTVGLYGEIAGLYGEIAGIAGSMLPCEEGMQGSVWRDFRALCGEMLGCVWRECRALARRLCVERLQGPCENGVRTECRALRSFW